MSPKNQNDGLTLALLELTSQLWYVRVLAMFQDATRWTQSRNMMMLKNFGRLVCHSESFDRYGARHPETQYQTNHFQRAGEGFEAIANLKLHFQK